MENMDFGSGGSTMIQYIPTIDDLPPQQPQSLDRQMGSNTRSEPVGRGEVPPAGPGALPLFQDEKTSDQNNNMMDFSSSIADVMPSASFEDDTPGGVNSATYTSPTTQRVTAVSPGMIGSSPAKKTGNPLGLTDEQFQAAVAGIAALLAFSKPVQDKLADSIPKFMSEAGELSTTGMAVTALIVAALYYFALKFLKNQA
jgi:hypothetical protein